MNKYLKYGAIALGAIVLILLAIPLFINANSFRPAIEKAAHGISGAQGASRQLEPIDLFGIVLG